MFGRILVDNSEAESSIASTESGFEKLGKKMTEIGNKVSSVGKSLTARVTAPIAALGGLITKIGMDFDTQMSKVSAVSGATGDNFDALRAKAQELGATTNFSATQAAEGMEYLALAGWKTDQILSAMPGMLNLAAAGALELGEAADITSDVMSAFGISAEKASHTADVFAYAQANANTNVQQMGEAMTYLAPVANALGWELEESAASVMKLADSGVKGSMAGQAFASSLSRLAKPTRRMSKEMERLGLDFFDAEGNMKSMPELMAVIEKGTKGMTREQKSSTLSILFGAEAYKHWAILLESGSEVLAKTTEELKTADGTAENMANTMMDNLGGAVITLKSALEGLAIQFSDLIKGDIRRFADWLTEMVRKFSDLDESTKKLILTIAGIVAAIGPVMIVLGTLISTTGTVITAFVSLGAAITNAGGIIALLTNPITIAIAAITAIVAALVTAYNKVDWFREMVDAAWNKIKEFTKVAFEAISKTISTIVSDVVVFAKGLLDKFKSFWDENGKFIMELVRKNFESILATIKMVMGLIKGVFEVTWPIISNVVKIAWELIKITVKTAIDIVLGIIQTVMKILQGDWKGAWETILKTVVNIWDNIKTFFKNVDLVQVGKDIIQGLINGIGSMASAVWEKAKDIATGIGDTIKRVLGVASPSKVAIQIGKWTGEGLAIGLDDMVPKVNKSSASLATAALPNVPNANLSFNKQGSGGNQNSQTLGSSIINYERMFDGAIFNVRDESDIKKIARELYNLQTRNGRVVLG